MSGLRPLLLVEGDAALRASLLQQIMSDGEFSPVEAESVAEAEAKLAQVDARYDVILLGTGLPDGDGHEFCAKLRRDGCAMPIIMIAGTKSDQDVIRGLNAGANDYLAQPFGVPELLARVRAQLRIFDNSDAAAFRIGSFVFRPSARVLQEPARNRRMRLTDKECSILKYLYRSIGKPVPRRTLLQEVWGYSSSATTHTIETHVYRLRQKLEADPSDPCLLLTTIGGYLLNAPTGHTAAA